MTTEEFIYFTAGLILIFAVWVLRNRRSEQ